MKSKSAESTPTTGTISRLSEQHFCVDPSVSPPVVVACDVAYNEWVFSSVRHLGEAADGDWILTVKDLFAADTGTFQTWSLKFYGT